MRIDSTSFGQITVEGRTYTHDIYAFWDGGIEEARTSVRHLFSAPELNFLLKKSPEIVIVGTGQYGSLEVSPEVESATRERGIKLIKLATPEAIEKFNELIKANRRVVAYFHITC